jgi:hypothetical protein
MKDGNGLGKDRLEKSQPDDHLNGEDPYNLEKLRVRSATAAQHIPTQLTRILIRRPKKTDVFVTHPTIDPVEIFTVLDDHDHTGGMQGTEYLVSPEVAEEYSSVVTTKLAFPTLTRHGGIFLWLIPTAGPDGRRSESANSQETVAWAARGGQYQQMTWDPENSSYIFKAKKVQNPPPWPESLRTMSDFLRLAYPGHRYLRSH